MQVTQSDGIENSEFKTDCFTQLLVFLLLLAFLLFSQQVMFLASVSVMEEVWQFSIFMELLVFWEEKEWRQDLDKSNREQKVNQVSIWC